MEALKNEKDYYKLLGVAKTASDAEIKKAYRKGALKYHPDRNKDPAASDIFKKMSHAYDVLQDKEKRRIYDQYGEEGLQGNGGGHSAEDIFSSFFGGGGSPFFGGGRRQPSGPRRTTDILFKLPVPLSQFFTGKERKLKITRNVICDDCKGSGAKAGSKGEITCEDCRGRGMVTETQQLRPGFISQSSRPCRQCGGQGKSIAKGDRCGGCKGYKVVEKPKVITVQIDKGMSPGEKIKFGGESHEAPGAIAGDLVVVLIPKDEGEDYPWTRQNNDLIYKKTISLAQALTGYSFNLKHLDGKVIKIESEKNDIINPRDIRMVKGQGMPVYRSPFSRGDLFIVFEIKFPTHKQVKAALPQLKQLLPKAQQQNSGKAEETLVAKTFDKEILQQRGRQTHSRGGATQAGSSDEEESGGCYQQ
eukprot:TRINITY_DN594_c0_g1_i1.p1 TRINITY_DN594_c0_g1~~TRINITY_DN594_c0_g1_i1.p1  ORF type:complete len:445 (-),score=86.14 TRINITY_DN594_c0_g1_i1:34-1284(-)